MKDKKTFSISILLGIGVLILANIISDQFFFRVDMTEDQRYSLSEATKNILEELPQTVTITAYFTEDLPPQYTKNRRLFKELLVEYASLAHGNLVYEFIDPSGDPQLEQQAIQNGVQPLLINVREKDQVSQQKAFMGAVVQMGEEKDVIPFIQPNGATEYQLSSSIKKLAVLDKPKVGFVQGQGEPGLQSFPQAMQELSVLYDIQPVQLNDTVDLSSFTTLAIIAPKDSFNVVQINKLEQYLSGGGNLFIGMNRVEGDFQTAMGSPLTTGLEGWLARKNIVVEDNFLIDANCLPVGVTQQQGGFRYTTRVRFPFIPIISNFADHAITEGLEQVSLPFASTISYNGDSTIHFTPLLISSEKSGTQSSRTFFDVNKKWANSDLPMQNLVAGALFEGKLTKGPDSRMIVIADGDFAVNGSGQQMQQLAADNVSLLVNSIDWLSDATGLIQLRTKGISARPLDQVEDSTKVLLKWLNFLLPIVLIIVYGIVRAQRRKIQRIKRMQEGYIK